MCFQFKKALIIEKTLSKRIYGKEILCDCGSVIS